MNKKSACYFTANKTVPSFRDTDTLRNFLTPRGKILSNLVSKLAPKYQRQLATEIKRARYLSLLPYTSYQSEMMKIKAGIKSE